MTRLRIRLRTLMIAVAGGRTLQSDLTPRAVESRRRATEEDSGDAWPVSPPFPLAADPPPAWLVRPVRRRGGRRCRRSCADLPRHRADLVRSSGPAGLMPAVGHPRHGAPGPLPGRGPAGRRRAEEADLT